MFYRVQCTRDHHQTKLPSTPAILFQRQTSLYILSPITRGQIDSHAAELKRRIRIFLRKHDDVWRFIRCSFFQNHRFTRRARETADQQTALCWREERVTSISIIIRLSHDSRLLASPVSFDESSSASRTATNYRDGRKLAAFKRPINQRIIYLRALFGIRLHAHQRQIGIGVPVMSHQAASEPRRRSGRRAERAARIF